MTRQTKRTSKDYIPVTVPLSATHPGETNDGRKDKTAIDAWAHPAVWNDRMLTTLLENRVRGGKWHTLIDKVFNELNLFSSAHKVLGKKGAAGVDRQTVDDFAETEREELARLHKQLREDSYDPERSTAETCEAKDLGSTCAWLDQEIP